MTESSDFFAEYNKRKLCLQTFDTKAFLRTILSIALLNIFEPYHPLP
jgi:hypothetical protein